MSRHAHEPGDPVARATHWVITQGVAVEHWPPVDDGALDRLHRRPIIFLVEPGAEPPDLDDDLASWMHLPGDAGELLARGRALVARARASGTVLAYVDDDDVLRVGDRLLILAPIEARIMRILLDHVGTLVPRERINRAIWPDRDPEDFTTLNSRVKRLRAAITRLPMHLHTVRGRGLLLEVAPPDQPATARLYRSEMAAELIS